MIAKSVGVSDKVVNGECPIVEVFPPWAPKSDRRREGHPLQSVGTKKGGLNRRPRLACHCTNRPFFQDIYVKYLMALSFQKNSEIFLSGANVRFS
jgi:hypothetical protein